jgi:hypothetical protein
MEMEPSAPRDAKPLVRIVSRPQRPYDDLIWL